MRVWGKAAALVGGFIAALLLARALDLPGRLTPQRLTALLTTFGPAAPIVYMLLMATAVVVSPIPSLPLNLTAGVLFGPLLGSLYSLLGAEVGALLAFLLARKLGKDVAERLLRTHLNFCPGCSSRYLTGVVFVSRLLPFISFDLVSYGAGLTAMRWQSFAIATFLGMIPITAALNTFGGSLAFGEGWGVSAALLLLGVLFLAPLLLERFNLWGVRERIGLAHGSVKGESRVEIRAARGSGGRPVRLEELFRESLILGPAPGPAPRLEGTLTFRPELQSGYPGTGHGGAVTAAVAEAGTRLLGLAGIAPPEPGPLTTSAALRKPLPLGTAVPVVVALEARKPSWRIAVRLGPPEAPLVEGELRPGEPIRLPPGEDLAGWGGRSRAGHPVPGLEWCLACGSKNPLGLQLRFDHDAAFVWKLYDPRAPYQGQDGRLFRGFPYIALDEIGWWLGALRAREVGVSTRLEVTVQGRAANGARVLLWGEREAVVPADRRGRSWLAPAYLLTEAGEPLAAGRVTFAASRAYAPALLPPLAAGSAPEAIRRVFPQYAPS